MTATEPQVRITPEQCRAARAFLGWSAATLARKSGVCSDTILAFERKDFRPRGWREHTIETLRDTFTASGVLFESADDFIVLKFKSSTDLSQPR